MIRLRPIEPLDEDRILEWRNMPEVSQFMYTDHQISPTEHQRWFERMLKSNDSIYWIVESEKSPVGVANLSKIDPGNSRCYWGFYLAGEGGRRKGIGSAVEFLVLGYVFETLKLNKLCGEVLGFNVPVMNMHRKFGVKEEGVLKDHIIKNGEKHDVICVAWFRDDFLRMRASYEKTLRERGMLPEEGRAER